ncbi:SDR family oxidoreductase [Acetobacter oeni]|uniref:Dehydrogenase n=1 Tax=Acetobacter oeni TaxID=304077 RepID=A0A511XK81_9PROT|nr:SDR family oxidoreductase [Acetobacter oeni]MBB3883148.1 NAD(P)-dependent dehydrogenase (short-subunit alcohol dehydrogenase family) [Acetobacter oeni]NHO19212.1 SDR family NAD(P)-dependent oxidoreductase [Acetobacter oeni]GBR05163.1 oxidoreductase [Acetobacter oeni LMG 21952]GEN63328.1 dehydrogenase [Acetobacter oeni]
MTDERGSFLSSLERLDGKVAVVTGANSGLGFEAACDLALLGARVILASRNVERNDAAVRELASRVPGARVEAAPLNLASLASVAEFSDRLAGRVSAVDVLINNAGVMAPPRRLETKDGFELQFGVNHLGHFALTARLKPLLECAPDGGIVVAIASLAAWKGQIRFDDLQSRYRYVPFHAYNQSKLANLMFGMELARRAKIEGWKLHARIAHPGWARTRLIVNGMGSGTGGVLTLVTELGANIAFQLLGQSAAEGAEPFVYAAASSQAEDGQYYGPTGAGERRGPPGPAVIPPSAQRPDIAKRLWDVSERLTDVGFD